MRRDGPKLLPPGGTSFDSLLQYAKTHEKVHHRPLGVRRNLQRLTLYPSTLRYLSTLRDYASYLRTGLLRLCS